MPSSTAFGECPPLADPEQGTITYAADSTANYEVGTVATYSCNDGYVLSIESSIRVCYRLGGLPAIWNGTDATCICKLENL